MTEVAVVGFAHAPHVRRTDGTTNGVEMLMPCFAEIYAELGLKQTETAGLSNLAATVANLVGLEKHEKWDESLLEVK